LIFFVSITFIAIWNTRRKQKLIGAVMRNRAIIGEKMRGAESRRNGVVGSMNNMLQEVQGADISIS
jgi:hypothetical protein